MKRAKFNRGNGIYARLSRIEGKCNYIISKLDNPIRESRQDEIDTIVSNLRATAKAIARECRDERLFFTDIVKRNRRI